MNKRTIVIIGGVAGGASAAARLRRLNEHDDIILFERGEHISFANCGLPYYIGETITSRDKLFVQTPEAMKQRFGIDVRVSTEVVRIDREHKKVIARSLADGSETEQSYDFLILSPGARPIVPPFKGLDEAANVFTLRNIPDTDRIKAYTDERKPRHAAIIGGGFIGVEMAENLRERGIQVTLIERNSQVLGPLDIEMARILEEHMELHGVQLITEDGVEAVLERGTILQLTSGQKLETDMIILAIGVTPENELAAAAGLELGVRGAIVVNEHLQTSDPSIYAVGDAIQVKNRTTGTDTVVPLAWGANRQGRLAADHINGRPAIYEGAYGTAIAKVFDLTAAVTGSNEKTLRGLGIPYEVVHIHPNSHAGYYPGAAALSIKLIFDKESGRIYGAQVVGAKGADKRIDVIATAMRGGLTASDLADIELAYAPPYASAKDPVNMAGYTASNLIEGLARTMQWHEADAFVSQGGLLIDVREPAERDNGYVPGSINIPLNSLRSRLHELPHDQEIVVSCQVGLRGYIAARMLEQHGYRVRNLDGGYKTYAYGNGLNKGSSSAAADVRTDGAVSDEGVPQEPAYKLEESVSAKPAQTAVMQLDVCGLQCPGPILKVRESMATMNPGDRLEIQATDFGFASDIQRWAQKMGHQVQSVDTSAGIVKAIVLKGVQAAPSSQLTAGQLTAPSNRPAASPKDGTTMVVFSGDLDKAIASFIIASGAAAMGKPVTMFFTFWGLNVLRKPDARVRKRGLDAMFGWMMPKGTAKLPISKMNMGGLGAKMIRHVMNKKNVDSLESLMQGAMKAGVKLVACTMSMDIMGIQKEELIEGIDYAGVASYLADADDAGINLFI